MPSGLDGNPDPLRTPVRDAVLDEVAGLIRALPRRPALVGIDGHSSAGKSTFADELAARLGDGACRSTTDSFHNPRAVRLPPGVDLAESYVELSHDLTRLRWYVLDPFRRGEGTWRAAAFDEPSDSPVDAPEEPVPADGVLLFDGLFLHRPELLPYWDLTVLLTGPSRAPRAGYRYVEGWRLYSERCRPEEQATIVIDNDELAAPTIVRRPGP